jgi:hypothetical protein
MSDGISTSRSINATVHPIGDLHIYEVTREEFITIAGNSFTKSLFSVLTGISISAFISFLIAIKTTTITDSKTYAVFIAVIIVFLLSTLICGFFWIKAEVTAYFTGKKYLDRA